MTASADLPVDIPLIRDALAPSVPSPARAGLSKPQSLPC